MKRQLLTIRNNNDEDLEDFSMLEESCVGCIHKPNDKGCLQMEQCIDFTKEYTMYYIFVEQE